MSRRPSWWLDVLKFYWPLNHWAAKATRLPLIGGWITFVAKPWMGKKAFNISYIPIQAKIDPPANTILAEEIIAELIRASAHRVVIKRCTCRDAKGCRDFPIENACLMLGEDTKKISKEIAEPLSVREALEYIKDQIALGLIPMTGRVRMDDLYYGVPNRGRMLTICFCCPCCCTLLTSAKYFPEEFRTSIVRLKGVNLGVDVSICVQCAACIKACFLDAISLNNGIIVHDESLCIGCGRCASVCPQGATRVELDDRQAAIDELLGRIRERVTVG